MAHQATAEMLGAHVSTSGGVATALARGLAIGASAIQVFTKTPNQWREPVVGQDTADAFRREVARTGITHIVSHDSYLINLASPDPVLRGRSEESFRAELERCRAARHPLRRLPSGQLHRRPRGGDPAERGVLLALPPRGAGNGRGAAGDDGGHRDGAREHVRGAGRAARRDRRGRAAPHRLLRRHLSPLFGGLRPGARLRRRLAAMGGRDRPVAAPLPPSQRLEDAVRLAPRPARADRRRHARRRAVPPHHARAALRGG